MSGSYGPIWTQDFRKGGSMGMLTVLDVMKFGYK